MPARHLAARDQLEDVCALPHVHRHTEEPREAGIVAGVQARAPCSDDRLHPLRLRRPRGCLVLLDCAAATTPRQEQRAGENGPAMHSLTLSEFTGPLGVTEVVNDAPVEITDLAYATRDVRPGALFFCLRGAQADGHAFAATAAAAGSVALVVEHPVEVALPQLSFLIACVHGRSSRAVLPLPDRRPPDRRCDRHERQDDDRLHVSSILGADGQRTGLLTNISASSVGRNKPLVSIPRSIDAPLSGNGRRR